LFLIGAFHVTSNIIEPGGTMKYLVLFFTTFFLFYINLYSQSLWREFDQNGTSPHELEFILTAQGRITVTPIATVRVDAVQNAAQMGAGYACGGEFASFENLPRGMYVVAISDGPGISNGGSLDVGCFVFISGTYWGGLHGFGSPYTPRSYIRFSVDVGEFGTTVHFCIADSDCSDNSGWVDVTLYKVSN
jgi:hypothetical protein